LISSLRGIVQQVGENGLILEVGGVGLRLAVPVSVLEGAPAPGQSLFLYTHLVVREDSLNLYGFASPEEKEIFETLLQVSGIGPRLALAMISHLSPERLRAAVANNQPTALTAVPGVGQKTAEKVIFHLKDRLGVPHEAGFLASDADGQVLDVLTSLGYTMAEAQVALRAIPPDSPTDIETRVRMALQYFARP
jgi:Holliday junction DNA helicase RuvA